MKKRLGEWMETKKAFLRAATLVLVGLGGGGAGVWTLAGGADDAQAASLAREVDDCQARVSALEQSISANQADHAAIIRSLGELHSDVREIRSSLLRGGAR